METISFTLEAVEGFAKGKRFSVESNFSVTLGRGKTCDVCILDPALSRTHCIFEVRGTALWVIDLNSANQTFLNNEPVTESQVRVGDRVSVGESVLCIMPAEESVEPMPSVDLGFSDAQDNDVSITGKDTLMRPLLWALAAGLVLLLGVMFIFSYKKPQPTPPAEKIQVLHSDRTLVLSYEQVKADQNAISRYAVTLDSTGMLELKTADVPDSSRQRLNKKKKLSPEAVKRLTQIVESSEVPTLQREYVGLPINDNSYMLRTLTVAIGKQVFQTRIVNDSDPAAFSVFRDEFDIFVNHELGVWALQYTPEEMLARASESFETARQLYSERSVAYPNLARAVRKFKEAQAYLETINPKPHFYPELVNETRVAEDDFKKLFKEQSFNVQREARTKNWRAAQRELRVLIDMLDDPDDERSKSASRQLLDVEKRLPR